MKGLLLCLLVFSTSNPLHAGGENLSELDNEIIKFFREEEVGTGATDYPDLETYHKKLDWYWDQGQKARPALMYLLTEVYEGDFSNMSRTMDALCAMDGDRSDILTYVRERLPKLNDPSPVQGKYGHIQVSLRVLGELGGPKDMALIQSFLNHPDVAVRSTAMTEERNLRERIEAGEFDAPKTRRKPSSNVPQEKHRKSPANGTGAHGKSSGSNETDSAPGWVVFLSTVLIAIALFVWKIGRRRHVTRDK